MQYFFSLFNFHVAKWWWFQKMQKQWHLNNHHPWWWLPWSTPTTSSSLNYDSDHSCSWFIPIKQGWWKRISRFLALMQSLVLYWTVHCLWYCWYFNYDHYCWSWFMTPVHWWYASASSVLVCDITLVLCLAEFITNWFMCVYLLESSAEQGHFIFCRLLLNTVAWKERKIHSLFRILYWPRFLVQLMTIVYFINY